MELSGKEAALRYFERAEIDAKITREVVVELNKYDLTDILIDCCKNKQNDLKSIYKAIITNYKELEKSLERLSGDDFISYLCIRYDMIFDKIVIHKMYMKKRYMKKRYMKKRNG